MTQYNVTPEYVSDAAQQADNTANDVMTQLTNLQTYVNQLVGDAAPGAGGVGGAYQWMGVTASQFAELMNNVHVYSVALHDALVDIGEGLRGNYVNYVNSEADNLRGLQTVDQGLLNTPLDPNNEPVTPATISTIPPAKL